MAKKYMHLSREILDKSSKVKNGIIWIYLCVKEEACPLEEIASHYKLSLKKTEIALDGMIEIGAVFRKEVDGKTLYRANPETYFHSDEA